MLTETPCESHQTIRRTLVCGIRDIPNRTPIHAHRSAKHALSESDEDGNGQSLGHAEQEQTCCSAEET